MGPAGPAGVWDFTQRAFQSHPASSLSPGKLRPRAEAGQSSHSEPDLRATRGRRKRRGGAGGSGVKALPLITQEVCRPAREEGGGLQGGMGRGGGRGSQPDRQPSPQLWRRPRSSSSQILPRPQQENRKAELGPLLPDGMGGWSPRSWPRLRSLRKPPLCSGSRRLGPQSSEGLLCSATRSITPTLQSPPTLLERQIAPISETGNGGPGSERCLC